MCTNMQKNVILSDAGDPSEYPFENFYFLIFSATLVYSCINDRITKEWYIYLPVMWAEKKILSMKI